MQLIYKLILITLILISLFGQINKPSQAQTIYVYVNHCREGGEPQDGSPVRPFATLTRAVAAAAPGSTLLVQAGNYSEAEALPLLISKRLTIRTWNGPVEVGSPSRTQKIGCTKRIAQLTGNYDPEGKPHINDTVPWGVDGVDLGANTEHNGKIYIFFGDVPLQKGKTSPPYPPQDADLIAHFDKNQDPEKGLTITPVRQLNGLFYPFTYMVGGSKTHLGTNQTPTGAFSYDNEVYVFIFRAAGGNNFISSLTSSPDPSKPQPFVWHFDLSVNGKFMQVAPLVVNNAELPGLPPTGAKDGLILFGQNHNHGIYLAWMPLQPGQAPDKSRIRYYKGNDSDPDPAKRWSPQETDAKTLIGTRWGWTSLSVGRIPETGQWILLYQRTWREDEPTKPQALEESIVARLAATPWGFEDPTEAGEIPIFTPVQDGAYRDVMNRGYMHRGWAPDGLEALPPIIRNNQGVVLPGFAYGAYLLNPYTRWEATTRTPTIYYLMSTGAPYQVQRMRSKIKVVNP